MNLSRSEILDTCNQITTRYPGNLRWTGVSEYWYTANDPDGSRSFNIRVYFKLDGAMTSSDFTNMGRVSELFPLWPCGIRTEHGGKGYLTFTRPS